MRRAAFGMPGAAIDAAAGNVEAWIDQALGSGADPGADATPPPTFEAVPALGGNATQAERQARNKTLQDQGVQLVTWWLRRMTAVQRPVLERITFGWHDHWATSITKVRLSSLMLSQNELLRSQGLGSFTALAQHLVVDPALMIWLDAEKNTAAAPNENLARELMELFVLGVEGGYTETDVKQSARALTGWVIAADGTVSQVPRRTDPGPETVLGTTARFTPQTLVDTLVAAPAHPGHVASRWWGQLASDDPVPPDVLSRLVGAYGTGRDCKALIRAILVDPGFAAASGSLVLAPVDWVVGSARALGVQLTETSAQQALGILRRLGQVPFMPPNVSGWPHGAAWVSTAAAATRAAAASTLAGLADLTPIADAPASSRTDAVAHLLGLDGFSPTTLSALALAKGKPAQLVATALISPDYLVV